MDGPFLVLSSIYIVGDDGLRQAKEGEVVKGKEADIHEVSSCPRVNECSGVDSFVLSLEQDGETHSSIAGGCYKYTIDQMGRRHRDNFPL